jgi:putative mRNA 3-end processing factor
MNENTLIRTTDRGFYCAAGDFYIDPWRPVDRAVITHAHADHFAYNCKSYLVSEEGRHVFQIRLGDKATIQTIPYGESVKINGVTVSLHPAGHILGSAQVRVEYQGEVWVVSGDYKREPDPTCTPFEVVPCHHFITEATFGLPIYRWPHRDGVFRAINDWWRTNQQAGKCTILYGYSLGKAQGILAGVDPSIGPIYTHGAVEKLNAAYRDSGIQLPPTTYVSREVIKFRPDWSQALIVAPPSTRGTTWIRRFGDVSSGFVSGWMRIRGTRRRRAVDRGFVLSDHVDWTALMQTIADTGAEHIYVTHGYTAVVTRWLRENGIDAHSISTRYTGENDEVADDTDDTEQDDT